MTGNTDAPHVAGLAPAPAPTGGTEAAAATATRPHLTTLDWLPAALVAFVAVVSIGAAQGGYFPTSWGPAVVVASAVVVMWLALGARTDAGWRDAALVGCLALFAVWVGLSAAWSAAPALSIVEFQRVLVVLTGVSAILVLAPRASETQVVYALMAGITVIAGYSLATRLAPGRIDDFDPSDYRLAGPIGYWNGLGTFTAMGIVLAVGIAVGSRIHWQRITASVALVVLAPTLYFTFSRGASVALACGVAAMLAITPRRISTLGALAILAPAPAIATIAAANSEGLTNQTTTLSVATADGRSLAWLLAGLGVLAAGAAVLLIFAETRVAISPRVRRAVGTCAIAAVVVAALAVVVRAGGPIDLYDRTTRAFDRPPKASEDNLNEHLFTFSGAGRVDMWRVAVSAYREHPVLGVGAGSFERYWQKDESAKLKARDAHSLYLETLTELGPVGLTLLLAVGAVIVSAALGARRNPIVPAALGAFAVYAVHAGVEWDWELTGVTLTAFLAGAATVVAVRQRPMARLARPIRLGVTVAVAGVALVSALGYIGNKALAEGQEALDRNDPAGALHDANIARTWAPWSPYPETVRGEALLGLGDAPGAKLAFQDAVKIDPAYWRGWLGLAVATTGDARARALERASSLYPNSVEIYETTQLLLKSESTKLK